MVKKVPGLDGQLKLVPAEKPPPPPPKEPKPPVVRKKEPPPEPKPPKEPKEPKVQRAPKAPPAPIMKPFVLIATDEQVLEYIQKHPGVRAPELIREFRIAYNRAKRLLTPTNEKKE